jgi:hypothetical protein
MAHLLFDPAVAKFLYSGDRTLQKTASLLEEAVKRFERLIKTVQHIRMLGIMAQFQAVADRKDNAWS